MDEAVSREAVRALQPGAWEAAGSWRTTQSHRTSDVLAVVQRKWEVARYAADRAQRQYDATDPENRVVAGELERVREIETRLA